MTVGDGHKLTPLWTNHHLALKQLDMGSFFILRGGGGFIVVIVEEEGPLADWVYFCHRPLFYFDR
jgi:hypothetical protein